MINKNIDWKFALLISAILTLLTLLNRSILWENGWLELVISGLRSFSFFFVVWVALSIIEVRRQQRLKTILLKVVFMTGVIFALFFLYSWLDLLFLYSWLDLPVGSKPFAMFKLFIGLLFEWALFTFTKTINRVQRLEAKKNQLEKINLRLQMDNIKQHINPHFLFNSLTTLRSMVRAKDQKSEEFVIKMSAVYNKLLAHQNERILPLQEEIDFLEDYIFMLKARFEENLFVERNLEVQLANYRLPTFGLQLLIENCVKHNIVSKKNPLHIKIKNLGKEYIRVENNYQPKLNMQKTSQTGLNNLREIYKLLNIENGLIVQQTTDLFIVDLKLIQP